MHLGHWEWNDGLSFHGTFIGGGERKEPKDLDIWRKSRKFAAFSGMRSSPEEPLIFIINSMIDKNVVTKLVEEWLQDKDYFLVDVMVSPDDKITVEIDHADGV